MGKTENSIFWIEIEKIIPNPYQPRREFDEDRLKELSDSIRQYGVLQPLVVSRQETVLDDGGIKVEYELIAGERRLRASKLARLTQVPVVVRTGDDSRAKLELAIIENLQREDLNSVERAQSFQRLADEFKLTWAEVGRKMGKSREYVSNTVRILMLPQDILDAISKRQISEGHTRPLLMLIDRPQEQMTLFKEMMVRKMTVREAEQIARRIAFEKVRKKDLFMTPEVVGMEEQLAETLGTRVQIEPRERGGRIWIDYFSHEELLALSIAIRKAGEEKTHKGMFDTLKDEDIATLQAVPNTERYIEPITEFTHLKEDGITPEIQIVEEVDSVPLSPVEDTQTGSEAIEQDIVEQEEVSTEQTIYEQTNEALDDRSIDEVKKDEQNEDLYNINKFTI
ncbi:ParB/RepB/Spo0J family partition protein [Candidatus Gracilibacteria bacterium]|nr:ParB/RepB/Spo0J family partition protein [Candidatus Gracilibacteria bacterium]